MNIPGVRLELIFFKSSLLHSKTTDFPCSYATVLPFSLPLFFFPPFSDGLRGAKIYCFYVSSSLRFPRQLIILNYFTVALAVAPKRFRPRDHRLFLFALSSRRCAFSFSRRAASGESGGLLLY